MSIALCVMFSVFVIAIAIIFDYGFNLRLELRRPTVLVGLAHRTASAFLIFVDFTHLHFVSRHHFIDLSLLSVLTARGLSSSSLLLSSGWVLRYLAIVSAMSSSVRPSSWGIIPWAFVIS